MSRENVEIVRTGFEAWNARDMDALRDLYRAEAILRMPKDWPEPGPFVGRDAVMRFFEQYREVWEADSVEPHGFIDAGDRVVVRHGARGSVGGPESSMEITSVYTLRGGKVMYDEKFFDYGEALQAAGLSEQAVSPENVEVVLGLYEAWNLSGGVPPLESMDPAIEAEVVGGLDMTIYRGHAGVSELLETFWGLFEGHHIEVEEYIPAGDDVAVTAHYYGRGKTSNAQVDMRAWHVWTVLGGKVARWRIFNTRLEALEAMGLSEQDARADS